MAWNVLLPLLLAALILFVLTAFLMRARRALLASRRAASYRDAVAQVVRRAESVFAELIPAVDGARRGETQPGAVQAAFARGRQQLGGLAGDVRAMMAPPGEEPGRDAIADELERAARAMDMVIHGCALVAGVDPRRHEVESQTSIKRGYLNLIHSWEALQEHAAAVTGNAVAPDGRWRPSRI